MSSLRTFVSFWLLMTCASVIDGQTKYPSGTRPVVAATAVASSSSQGVNLSTGLKQNGVQQINPAVAGVVGSLLGSIFNGFSTGYRPGSGLYSGNGYLPQNGGYYSSGGYYPMNGGIYPASGSYYPTSGGFNSGFGGIQSSGAGYYPTAGFGNGVQASAVVSQGGYRPNGNQGYRPNGNQGYRPGGAGGYRPYNSQTLKNPTTVYGQAGNRPGYYQVASAYASTSSNGRPLQVIYIKRVPSTRNRDLQELSDDSFYLQG